MLTIDSDLTWVHAIVCLQWGCTEHPRACVWATGIVSHAPHHRGERLSGLGPESVFVQVHGAVEADRGVGPVEEHRGGGGDPGPGPLQGWVVVVDDDRPHPRWLGRCEQAGGAHARPGTDPRSGHQPRVWAAQVRQGLILAPGGLPRLLLVIDTESRGHAYAHCHWTGSGLM